VTIRIQPGFRFIGRFSFSLGTTFEGERYIFADSDNQRLRRLVILHFEHVKHMSDEIYRYKFESSEQMGSLQFLRNCFAFSGGRETVRSPRGEAEMTDNFLISRGFQIPTVWLVSRFVTLGAADRKSEMIVFYMEGSDQLALQDLYDGEEPTKRWEALKPEITARARNAFSIE
jgi:hypothetical protein